MAWASTSPTAGTRRRVSGWAAAPSFGASGARASSDPASRGGWEVPRPASAPTKTGTFRRDGEGRVGPASLDQALPKPSLGGEGSDRHAGHEIALAVFSMVSAKRSAEPRCERASSSLQFGRGVLILTGPAGGAWIPKGLPRLTLKQILTWADAHSAATGRWPTIRSGPVRDALGEDWSAINSALWKGFRGSRGDSSLAWLLAGQAAEAFPGQDPGLG
jgi:hypothetical protein